MIYSKHEATVAGIDDVRTKTFGFNFYHPVFGKVDGVARIPLNVDFGSLTVDDVTLQALSNGLGIINMEIINYPELRAAKMYALNFLTVNKKS